MITPEFVFRDSFIVTQRVADKTPRIINFENIILFIVKLWIFLLI